ncbi:hypothetical protein VTJ49DRAFT_6087 [Mycothermus thermophilus]|uniref:UDP-N-acetylglucosamine transferase subunit ALG13 n=1 Tax=Humicola insolens TaxID=85995 RepID=A0ABR3V223_HUMIN
MANVVDNMEGVVTPSDVRLGASSDDVAKVSVSASKQHQPVASRDTSRATTHAAAALPALPGRRCFVTVGATAGFWSLLEEVTSSSFLGRLAAHGFTTLDIQCGPDLAGLQERLAAIGAEERHGLQVRSFGYTSDLEAYLLGCRGVRGARPAGIVVAHAGSGTVGEVLSVGAPLIVVANPTLMDNHQLELAEDLEEDALAVHGQIGGLTDALDRIAERIAQGTFDLPPHRPPPFPVPEAERITIFDWMVLTCYPDELRQQEDAADLAAGQGNGANGTNGINGINGTNGTDLPLPPARPAEPEENAAAGQEGLAAPNNNPPANGANGVNGHNRTRQVRFGETTIIPDREEGTNESGQNGQNGTGAPTAALSPPPSSPIPIVYPPGAPLNPRLRLDEFTLPGPALTGYPDNDDNYEMDVDVMPPPLAYFTANPMGPDPDGNYPVNGHPVLPAVDEDDEEVNPEQQQQLPQQVLEEEELIDLDMANVPLPSTNGASNGTNGTNNYNNGAGAQGNENEPNWVPGWDGVFRWD